MLGVKNKHEASLQHTHDVQVAFRTDERLIFLKLQNNSFFRVFKLKTSFFHTLPSLGRQVSSS